MRPYAPIFAVKCRKLRIKTLQKDTEVLRKFSGTHGQNECARAGHFQAYSISPSRKNVPKHTYVSLEWRLPFRVPQSGYGESLSRVCYISQLK